MSEEHRIGLGYDSHRFAEGRKLVLGGVEFEGEKGLEGHSDADIVTHAVIDALLGSPNIIATREYLDSPPVNTREQRAFSP